MENEKPKYQPWNEEEFQSDVFVRGMTAVQRWMYRSLLQASFFHTTRPFLPNDDRILWVLAGCESKQQWLDNKTDIIERFTPVENRPDLLENKRVTKDWNNLLDVREEMAEKGRKRAATAERESTGQFKPKLLISQRGTSGEPAALASGASGEPAREEKLSEVKVSEEKESKATNTHGDGGFSQPCVKNTGHGSDWSNIRRAHRNIFGKKPDKSRFGRLYENACKEHTEEIVLACFAQWAPSAKEWVKRENIDGPLHAFLKKLPDLAADEIESKKEEIEIAVQATKEEEQRNKNVQAVEESIRKQKEADSARMNATPPPENGASVLDYLAEMESPNVT